MDSYQATVIDIRVVNSTLKK